LFVALEKSNYRDPFVESHAGDAFHLTEPLRKRRGETLFPSAFEDIDAGFGPYNNSICQIALQGLRK